MVHTIISEMHSHASPHQAAAKNATRVEGALRSLSLPSIQVQGTLEDNTALVVEEQVVTQSLVPLDLQLSVLSLLSLSCKGGAGLQEHLDATLMCHSEEDKERIQHSELQSWVSGYRLGNWILV